MSFTIGSLFSGSGGFELAAFMCGGTPIWASEIECYPIAVTKSRFPYLKHLGSVTDIKGNEVEPVDVITFGSPCQDLSVAGKRAGLKHTDNGDEETTRSGLFMEAVRIIKEMREATNGEYPRFAIWENVPGAFSSNKGEDFRIVLEELIKIVEPTAVMPAVPKKGWSYADYFCGDGWSLAYRVFDAQYWGVPQRRRRIYLVLDLGGQCAGKVSFECEGLRGYFAEGRTPWKATAGNAENCIGTADCERNCVAYSVQDRAGKPGGGKGMLVQENRATSLRTGNYQYIFQPVAYGISPYHSNCMKSSNPHSGIYIADTARTLDAMNCGYPGCNQGGIAIVEPLCMATQQGGAEIMEDKCPTITASAGMSGNNQPVVCYDVGEARLRTPSEYTEISPTITARCGTGGNNVPAVVLPSTDNLVLDDQGGSQISVREDGKCPTLRAEMHGNVPCVLSAGGFCPETGGNDPSRSIAFQEELSPTLRAGTTPAIVGVYKADDGSTGNVSPTLVGDHNNRVTDHSALVLCCEPVAYNGENITSPLNKTNPQPGDPCHTLGTDSRNYLVEAVCCLEGNGSRPSHRGDGWRESETMYTLNTTEQHSVAYSLETFYCEAEEEITAPLKARDYKDPLCVAIDRAYFNQGQNALYTPQTYEDGTVPTLVAKGPSAVAYGVDCRNATESAESNGALQAACCHNHNSNNVVRIRYIVRRLTPTECARLQGFPDRWATPDQKSSFTDEEYEFWLNVRNTKAEIEGKAVKEYTKDQMLNWYNKLHTDSSEYKLWGNGIALPNALYVMQGIAEVFANERG